MNAPDKPWRVALVDDHAVVRQGYRRLLDLEGGVAVVDEHGDGESLLAALQRSDARDVDVVVLDLGLPGRSGLDVLQRVRSRWPWVRLLVFSMHASPAMVGQAFAAGADGYVTKSSAPETLVAALRRVAVGERDVRSPDLPPDTGGAAAPAPAHTRLSPREFDVMQALVQGIPLEVIAERLHVSVKTVSNYQTLVRQKLGVGSALELLRYARAHGIAHGD